MNQNRGKQYIGTSRIDLALLDADPGSAGTVAKN
jgi:hypothetical protein